MKTLIISLKIFLFFTILTGIIYPLMITGIAQIAFPFRANGSLVIKGDKIAGSELIGQQFDSSVYFSSRPSSTSYSLLPSGGSNLALTNSKLRTMVAERRSKFIEFNQLDTFTVIPPEMLFASGSGLDPHISPESAQLQAGRIARARNLTADGREKLNTLIMSLTERPRFQLPGEDRINVFILNLMTDSINSMK